MIKREIELATRSFFLLGPRQTGKSTWLRSIALPNSWFVNLLHNDTYFRYLKNPSQFRVEAIEKIRSGIEWIIIDEVQRIPQLLNEVHSLMEEMPIRFILSGSSARKLKRGGANMLGGRALLRHMHPFTVKESQSVTADLPFDLERSLLWGTLPAIHGLSPKDATETLRAYTELYVREEIQQEALVRNLGGFTRFLDLSAAYSGEIVNFNSIAKESGLPNRTVQSYYEILEDTLITFRLPAWRESPTKRLLAHPKIYLFDNGVSNSLCNRMSGPLDAATRGRMFEQFFIQETRRRLEYQGRSTAMYYWRTNNGAEVDLVLEENQSPILAIEFKSRAEVDRADMSGLRSFHEDYPSVPCIIVCTAAEGWTIDFVKILPWQTYLSSL